MIIRLFILFTMIINFSISSEIELYKEIRIYSPDSKVISDLNRNLHLDHVHLSDEGDLIFVVSESELDIINSMDPDSARELVEGSKIIKQERGGHKGPVKEEKPVIDFAYASVVTIKKIK